MAEPTQFLFTHKEVVTALIRQQGLRTGKWRLTVNFGFGAANVGPTEAELNPAAIATVNAIGLQLAAETDNSNLCVDAATVDAPKAAPKAAPAKARRS